MRPRYWALLLAAAPPPTAPSREELEETSRDWRLRLVDRAHDLFCVADQQGRFLRLSPAWEQVLGWSRDELMAQPFLEFVHPEDRALTEQEAATLVEEDHRSVLFENRYRTKDGDHRWLQWNAVAADGLIYSTVRDITPAKQAMEERRLLAETASRIDEAEDVDEALTVVLEELGRYFEASVVEAWLPGDEDEAQGLRFACSSSQDAELHSVWVAASSDLRFPFGKEAPGQIAELKEPVWMEGLTREDDFARHQAATSLGLVSGLCVPIFVEERMETTLCFFFGRSIEGRTHMAELAESLGSQVGWMLARRRAADQLREEERRRAATAQRLRRILDSVGDGVLGLDPDGSVSFANPAAVELLEAEAGTLTGGPFEAALGLEDEASIDAVQGVLRGEPAKSGSGVAFRRQDGQRFSAEFRVSPIRDLDGAPEGAVLVFQDISERERMEDILRRSNQELEMFAYVASHDLQEPLGTARAYVELLERRIAHALDDKTRRYMEHITTATTRMSALIDDLLTFSRIQREERLHAEVDLEQVVAWVQSDLGNTIYEKKAEVTVGPLPTVWGDRDQLRRLLQNLIGNALKYHRPEVPPVVRVRAEDVDDQWRIVVEDEGIGIDPKHHERVFAIFQRLHRQAEYPGTGIGLAIAKRIVEGHGGDIGLEPREGNGSLFWFTLPKKDP